MEMRGALLLFLFVMAKSRRRTLGIVLANWLDQIESFGYLVIQVDDLSPRCRNRYKFSKLLVYNYLVFSADDSTQGGMRRIKLYARERRRG